MHILGNISLDMFSGFYFIKFISKIHNIILNVVSISLKKVYDLHRDHR